MQIEIRPRRPAGTLDENEAVENISVAATGWREWQKLFQSPERSLNVFVRIVSSDELERHIIARRRVQLLAAGVLLVDDPMTLAKR